MLLALPGLVGLWLAWLAPAEEMADFIATQVTETTGFPLHLGRVRVNLWGGLDLDSVRVYYPPVDSLTESSDALMLRVDRVSVRYRLMPLLARRFEVAAVQLENPAMHIDPDRLTAMAPLPEEGAAPYIDSTASIAAVPLPVGFGLDALTIHNIDLSVTLPDTLPVQRLMLSGLSLSLEDVRVPRDVLENPAAARGRLRLNTESAQVVLGWPGAEAVHALDMDWQLAWQRGAQWSVLGRLGLDLWRFNVDVNGEGLGDSARLNTLALRLGDARLFALQGEVDKDRQLSGRITSDLIALGDLLDSARRLAGPLLPPDSLFPAFSGRIQAFSGRFDGTVEDLQFSAASALDGLSVALPDTLLDLPPLQADVQIEGRLRDSHLESGRVRIQAKLPGLYLHLPDSGLALGALNLSARAVLDEAFLPDSAWIEGRWQDVLGATLSLDGAWQRGDTLYWPAMAAQLKLAADSLDVETLPGVPPEVAGQMDLGLALTLRPGGRLALGLHGGLHGLRYAYLEEPVSAPSLAMEIRGAAHWPVLTEGLVLDSLILSIGDGVAGRMTAGLNPLSGAFWANLQYLRVQNRWLWSLVPAPLSRQLPGLTLSGQERLSARISGTPLADSLALAVEGVVAVENVAVAWPENALSVNGIEGRLNFHGNGVDWGGVVGLDVRETVMMTVRPAPFEDLSLSAHWAVQDLDSLSVSAGRLLSQFGLHGQFNLAMAGLSGLTPRLSAAAHLGFDGGAGMEIIDQIRLSGEAGLTVSASMTLAPEAPLHLHGELATVDFKAAVDTLLTAGPVNGVLPFSMQFDPQRRLFIQDRSLPLIEATDYARHRKQYQRRMPGLGTLRIDTVNVTGQSLGPAVLDTRISSGRLELPWLYMEGLSGNIGGAMHVIARGGSLDSLAYGFSLDVARINSAALLSSGKDLKAESELNATARFTGQGIDFTREVDVSGYFHITKIGPQFASTLLLGMDPKGRDRNIRLTRRLLNMGWKPRLFSFEMRHGYVYPSLVLDQPWYSPIRLPEQMGLGRLPLAFFIQNINTFSQ